MALPWDDDYVAELKGSASDNPADDGLYSVTVALAGILPIRTVLGEIEETATRRLIGRSEQRIEFAMVAKPMTVMANIDPTMQDYGICWQLQKVLGCPFIHIMALYKVNSDHAAGAIPRARLDVDTGLTDDAFWTTEITLPRATVVEGEVKPAPNFDTGTVDMSWNLVSLYTEP